MQFPLWSISRDYRGDDRHIRMIEVLRSGDVMSKSEIHCLPQHLKENRHLLVG